MVVVVMGVSGCGKSTVGRLLADRMKCPFLDADDFHPPENVKKMRAGTPLTDADRKGWLERLRREVVAHLQDGSDLVLACSALREAYRRQIAAQGEPVVFAYLRGSFEVIRARMQAREGHFMPASLLQSQFATLEEPADAVDVPVELEPGEAVARILRAIGLDPRPPGS